MEKKQVYAEATIAFPMIVAATFAKDGIKDTRIETKEGQQENNPPARG